MFTPEEAYAADEAFLTSASQFVMPIVEIDGKRIGGGQPGPIARKLRELVPGRSDGVTATTDFAWDFWAALLAAISRAACIFVQNYPCRTACR